MRIAIHFGSRSFLLPVAGKQRKKVRARAARFRQHFVAAISVISSSRGANQNRRFGAQIYQRINEHARGIDAAASEDRLSRRCPAASGNACAAQVHHSIRAFHRGRVHRRRHRIPRHVARGKRAAGTHQPRNGMPLRTKSARERFADKPGGTRNHDFHFIVRLRGSSAAPQPR